MNKLSKIMTGRRRAISASGLSILLLICICGPNRLIVAAQMSEARVTQVIQDVKLLPSNAAPRPAAINDNVREGTAVRTGQDSRTELTFPDLTLTRLGANSIFSFNAETRTLELGQGSVLMQVPPKAAALNVKTAAVTAAITGGTALYGAGPPVKFMVLEGTGTFYPPGHPEEAVTLHGGDMITLTPDGHFVQATFDVKKVVQTSELIVPFPDLGNLPLILEVIQQQDQQADQGQPGSNPPPKDNTDIVDQRDAAAPSEPSGPPSEFGPPVTITSPNPYVIGPNTQFQTDPTITSNGVTNFGTFYRGTALDGTVPQFLFGEAPTTFDQLVFSGPQDHLPVAVFKFANLQLTGDPTVTVPAGGATNLALVSVGDITSGGPGGTLTFGGQVRVDFITQNGSINLGSEISFNVPHLTFYARGSGSNLTLGSAVTASEALKLYAEGTIQVNGNVDTSNFVALSNGDFLTGSGIITATNVDIESLSNINIDGSKFPNPPDSSGSFVLNATNTLNIAIVGGGQPFGWDTFSATATTINLTSSTPVTFNFSNSSSVTFTAGTGGINAANIDFVGSPSNGWSLISGGSISVHSINTEDATISAATSFTAAGDVTGPAIGSTLTAGTTVDVGGNLFVITLTAGGNINVGNNFIALNVNAPSSILTVQGNIGPFGGEGLLQYTYNVDSIVAPAGINFSFNGTPDFVGKLTINANTLTFDPATGVAFANFNGVNANTFGSGNPAEGGDGGTFIVNTTGNITTVSGSDITATTGQNLPNSDSGSTFSGAGGTVELNSSAGSVTVDSRIEVSSAEPQSTAAPFRASARGGNITVTSGLTTGQGITVGANAQLLSLLDVNAPGPGGTITLSTMGANITVAAGATIEADRGTITIDQNDPVGATPLISLGGTLSSEFLNVNGAGDVNIGETADLSEVVTWHIEALGNITTGDLDFFNDPVNSSGNVFISAGQALTTGNIDIDNGYPEVADALNYTFHAGTDLTVNGYISVYTTTGTASGGNVSLTAGGNIAVTDSITINISPGGDFVTGANITLSAGGNLTTPSFDLETSVYNKTTIQDGGNIDIEVGGNLTVSDSSTLSTSAFNLGAFNTGGNITMHVTGDATLHNFLDATVDTSNGGSIGTGGNIALTIDHDFIVDVAPNIQVHNEGGQISTGGNNSLTVGNNLTAPQGIELDVLNGGGSISSGGNVTIEVDGSTTAASLGGYIDDSGGSISTGGVVSLHTVGTLALNGGLALEVDNYNGGDISTGGNIMAHFEGDVTNTAGNFHSLNFFILNGNGFFDVPGAGSIGTGGSIDLTFDGSITDTGATATQEGFYSQIQNGGGEIGTGGNITVTVTGTTSVGPLVGLIENANGGVIGTGGSITYTLGDVTAAGRAFFELNNQAGEIDSGVTLSISATSISTGALFNADIINSDGGSIGGDATITVTSGETTIGGNLFSQIDNNFGSIGGTPSITFDLGNLSVTGNASFLILAQPLTTASGQTSGFPGPASISVTANSIMVGGDLNAYIDSPLVTGGVTADDGSHTKVESFGSIDVTGHLNVLGTVLADDTVTVGTLSVTNLDTQGNDTVVGAGGIVPFAVPNQLAPYIMNTISTRLITSAGGINFNGIAADGDFTPATDANSLTINALTVSFGPTGDIMGPVAFNGGDGSSTFSPGSGGTLIVNATSDITVNSLIEATSGLIAANSDQPPAGAGGAVTLNSTSGAVTVTDRIQVSSAEPTSTVAPYRQSASAGNITIKSGKANGQAISIGSSAQLLSLLSDATPGSGGTIEVSATGNNSTIDVDNGDGNIEADGGTILIQNHGAGGMINVTNANMSADVIKIQVLGNDGTLKIGGGMISADSALNLYAAGSNGSIEFTASVTLSSGVAAVIAANTVTIDNQVTVTINSPVAAQLYANVKNYTGSGGIGNGTDYGSFAGTGAPTTTQPFPPSGGPGAAAAVTTASTAGTNPVSKSNAITTAASSLPTNTGSKSGNLTVVSAAQTSKTLLSTKRFVATQNLVASHPVTAPLVANKTTMSLANSGDLLSLLETGSQSGDKINVAKPKASNRAPKSGGVNSANSTVRRGNVVHRGSLTSASGTKVTTVSPSAEATGNVPFRPANTSAITNVARPASN